MRTLLIIEQIEEVNTAYNYGWR